MLAKFFSIVKNETRRSLGRGEGATRAVLRALTPRANFAIFFASQICEPNQLSSVANNKIPLCVQGKDGFSQAPPWIPPINKIPLFV